LKRFATDSYEIIPVQFTTMIAPIKPPKFSILDYMLVYFVQLADWEMDYHVPRLNSFSFFQKIQPGMYEIKFFF